MTGMIFRTSWICSGSSIRTMGFRLITRWRSYFRWWFWHGKRSDSGMFSQKSGKMMTYQVTYANQGFYEINTNRIRPPVQIVNIFMWVKSAIKPRKKATRWYVSPNLYKMVTLKRLELLTLWFEVRYSIQLSYRAASIIITQGIGNRKLNRWGGRKV